MAIDIQNPGQYQAALATALGELLGIADGVLTITQIKLGGYTFYVDDGGSLVVEAPDLTVVPIITKT